MSLWDEIAGTPTEKKRGRYADLRDDLNRQLEAFNLKLQILEERVEAYRNSRPSLNSAIIPEDVFATSEKSVKEKLETILSHQKEDRKKLEQAKNNAHERWKHYAALAQKEADEKAKK